MAYGGFTGYAYCLYEGDLVTIQDALTNKQMFKLDIKSKFE